MGLGGYGASGLQALLLLPVIVLTAIAMLLSDDTSALPGLGLLLVALSILEVRFVSDLGKALLAIRVVNRVARYHQAEAQKALDPAAVVRAALTEVVERMEACAP